MGMSDMIILVRNFSIQISLEKMVNKIKKSLKNLAYTGIIVLALAGGGAKLYAKDIYVPRDYSTIQAGIDAAEEGDIVHVSEGTYTEASGEIFPIVMKDGVSLYGAGIDNTIIKNTTKRVWELIIASNNATISGFTLSGTGSGWPYKAVIRCNSVSPEIKGNFITAHRQEIDGRISTEIDVGISCSNSSALITGNIIDGPDFNGIVLSGSPSTITNNVITNFYRYGIDCVSSSPKISNNILKGKGTRSQGISCIGSPSPTIISYNNIFGCQGCLLGLGNISADPLFVDLDNGDYHLLEDSPCINTGDPNYIAEPNETDLDGNPRIIGGRIDMGAYEFNHIPVACIVDGNQVVEAEAPWGARVTLDGSCSNDGDSTPGTNDDIVYFDWYKVDACDPNFEDYLGSDETIDCNLPFGEHIIVLEVTDKAGVFDTNEVTIIVQDTTPPDFTLSVTPTTLWPANHKMVLITPSWTVSDICDDSPIVSLMSITMNESDEAAGDGHTTDDIKIDDDGSIYLRAKRSGTGSGRIYTITYQAVDDSENVAVASATVTVPHDQR